MIRLEGPDVLPLNYSALRREESNPRLRIGNSEVSLISYPPCES